MKNGIIVGGLFLIATLALIAVTEKASVEKIAEEVKVTAAASFDDDFVGFMNAKTIPNIVYNVDTRFIEKISKAELHAAKSIHDIFPEEASKKIAQAHSNRLVKILPDGDKDIWGSGEKLSDEQLGMIKTLDYSADFYLETECVNQYSMNEKVTYFFSITAETPAKYKGGKQVLADYLRKESLAATLGIQQEKLRAGRINFHISKQGDVTNTDLESTSGYDLLDERMMELMEDLPEGWSPALDAEGNPVEEKLVVFFGIQGC